MTRTERNDALTVREVLETRDAARLMWMAAWRLARRGESAARVRELLVTHHTARERHVMRAVKLASGGRYWPHGRRVSPSGDAR